MSRRLLLVTSASTRAQRDARFTDDDTIEPPDQEDLARTRATMVATVASPVATHGTDRAATGTALALGFDADADPALGSWNLGSWAGRSVIEVAEADPTAFGAWRTDPAFAPPGGESLDALLTRAHAWLAEAAKEDRPVVGVADVAIVRAIVTAALGAPAAMFWLLDPTPLSSTLLTNDGRMWRLRALGG